MYVCAPTVDLNQGIYLQFTVHANAAFASGKAPFVAAELMIVSTSVRNFDAICPEEGKTRLHMCSEVACFVLWQKPM